MKDTKTIGISALISLMIFTAGMITPTFFEEDKYYCESKSLVESCSSLSGGKGTRCYLTPEADSWLFCREGWTLINNDLPIQEQEKDETLEPIKPPVSQSRGVWGITYTCDIQGCKSELST
jgi:hypothetical protein